jgi:hypothetical protein
LRALLLRAVVLRALPLRALLFEVLLRFLAAMSSLRKIGNGHLATGVPEECKMHNRSLCGAEASMLRKRRHWLQ